MWFGERSKLLGSVATLLFTVDVAAEPMQLSCPARYPERPVELSTVPQGWHGIGKVGERLPLDGGGLIDGSIDQGRAELIGDGPFNTKDGQEFRYSMNAGEKWFFCSYGGVELFHRIKDEVRNCRIHTERRKTTSISALTIRCD